MHEAFLINGLAGEKKLEGEIKINGAKNAVLQAFAFSLLFKDEVSLSNVPKIEDTDRMSELLAGLSATVEQTGETSFVVRTKETLNTEFPYEISRRLRASIVLTGPMLAREGEVRFPHPGGCVIGNRPIDVFLESFTAMGATITEDGKYYVITAPIGKNEARKLRGTTLFLRVPSVTATQTLMMAGVLAEGTTVIKNSALEPETVDLANFLNTCGARIEGAGTTTITVHGGELLSGNGKVFQTPPDRIEAGSFAILGALSARDLHIKNCAPEQMDALLYALRGAGVPLEIGPDSLRIHGNSKPNSAFTAFDIKTKEYPGFPTDLQAPAVVFLTQASGESLVFETIFEGRLNYTEGLVRMGAEIKTWDTHRATIKGPTPLRGRHLEGPDIRAGLAYIIASIVAQGESTVHNAYYVDRGYEAIENRLQSIGVDISRISA